MEVQGSEDETIAPIIDIAPFSTSDSEAKNAVARALARACEGTGFYLITGHGIAPDLLERMVTVTRAFFALSDEQKARSAAVGGKPGYRPVASRVLGATRDAVTPPDLKEGFSMGPLLSYRGFTPEEVDATDARRWFEPNVWPEDPPAFREIWTAYYQAMDELARKLMRISAVALGLTDEYFDARVTRHITHLNANGYPPLTSEPLPGQFRAGPHSDYGALTILWKDEGAGNLEVMDKSGRWRPVLPHPGCFIVNIGDLMARWTNDRWVSTLHRVVMPRNRSRDGGARLSIPYFYMPNYDALIETIETCIDAENPSKYVPITVGNYVQTKVDRHFAAART